MQATKNARTFQASGSNAAGATATGSTVDLRTALGCLISATIANGTAPTIGCDFVVEVSNDGSTWVEFARATAPTTASTTFPFNVQVPAEVLYARTKFTGNTGQAVTVAAYGHELTSIA